MTDSFEKYSDILLDAHLGNIRANDLSFRKREIFDEIFQYYNCNFDNVLFVGFGSWLLTFPDITFTLTSVSLTVREYLISQGVKFKYVELNSLTSAMKSFDVVVAMDEYFTFSTTDKEQRDQVTLMCNLASKFVMTTLKDYKNQDYRDREFSYPVLINSEESKKIFLEHYEFEQEDRNIAVGTSYTINDDGVTVIGPFDRRNMYFKQLAKFSMDAGGRSFLVHKSIMYKSMIKRNYEHIITINF
jgi:hypothetical protein